MPAQTSKTNLDLSRQWKQSRNAKANDFGVKLPVGEYVGQSPGAKLRTTKKGDIAVITIVVTGPNMTEDGFKPVGKQEELSHFLYATQKQTIGDALDRFSGDLKLMGIPDDVVKSTESVEEAIALVAKYRPKFKFRVTLGRDGERKFLNLIAPLPADDDDGGDDPDDTPASDNSVVDDDDITPDDGSNWEPQRGEGYLFTVDEDGTVEDVPCKVDRVNRSKETVALSEIGGTRKWSDVAWNDLGNDYVVED